MIVFHMNRVINQSRGSMQDRLIRGSQKANSAKISGKYMVSGQNSERRSLLIIFITLICKLILKSLNLLKELIDLLL